MDDMSVDVSMSAWVCEQFMSICEHGRGYKWERVFVCVYGDACRDELYRHSFQRLFGP